jgi:hypothetical protein
MHVALSQSRNRHRESAYLAAEFELMHSLNASVFRISRNVLSNHTQKMQVTARDLVLTEEVIRQEMTQGAKSRGETLGGAT